MKVKQMVEMAKNGDKEAKNWLDEHYEPIVGDYVKRKYGEENSYKMIELLPSLIDYYIENNIKDDLVSFLDWKADTLFKPKKEIKLIGDIYPLAKEKQEFVINHYANKLYEKIKIFNNFLSLEELKEYSFILIKQTLVKESKIDIRTKMNQFIAREFNYYKEDEELLLQKYIIYFGLTDKVLSYFYDKYKYIISFHKRMGQNAFAKQNYNIIIKNTLTKLKKPTKSIETLILLEMNALYEEEISNVKQIVSSFKDGNPCDFLCVYEFYAYIKEIIFNNFSGQVIFDDEKLKEQIEIKYNDYVNAYLNGTTKANMPRYINTRLTTYFNRCLKQTYQDDDKIKLNKKQSYRKKYNSNKRC